MTKRRSLLPAVIAMALMTAIMCASGCALPSCAPANSRAGVERYVAKVTDEHFTVSEQAKLVTDPYDGGINYLWTVTEDDGTEFLVLLDMSTGEGLLSDSRFYNNRGDVYFRRYIANKDLSGLEVRDLENSRFGEAYLYGVYRSRAELDALIDKANELVKNAPLGVFVYLRLKFLYPGRELLPDGTASPEAITVADIDTSASAGKAMAEDWLLNLCIDMHYSDILSEFSSDEIHGYVKGRGTAIGCRRGDGSYVFYNDLLLRDGSCVSFPTMYDLLVWNGYPVEGTMEHYSFDGIDGVHYEIEFDPCGDGSYSFTADGQERLTEPSWYRHIGVKEFYGMTGIYIDNYSSLALDGSADNDVWMSGSAVQ